MEVDDITGRSETGTRGRQRSRRPGAKIAVVATLAVVIGGGLWWSLSHSPGAAAGQPAASPPKVVVSAPLQQELDAHMGFLGQFSAVDQVELRAQVGGTLTEIRFKDGEIVHKGDLLFVVDPTPYEIKLSQASARQALAKQEMTRATALKETDAGTLENVEQRQADLLEAEAAVRDARFDLDHTRIVAPFTGRIGSHMVSVGNLVSGSRAGTSPTTLLATIVSVDPIYLNFDMSEADYMAFSRERVKQTGALADKVEVALSDEENFSRQGTLNFVDNVLDRSSGTIHARATVSNADLLLTPGGFARVRLAHGAPVAALLLPDAAVMPDQSQHVVLTVGSDGTVVPKLVQIGDIRGGLRVIRSGLAPTDKVIIEGLFFAAPGSKVAPQEGAIRFASDQGEK